MGKKKSKQSALTRTPSTFLSTLALLLLAPACLAQDDNSLPEIIFQHILHATFPDNTLDRFYECLCDIEIIHCRLSYKLRAGVTQFSLPYPLTVSSLEQFRAPSGDATRYKNVLKCDVMQPSAHSGVECHRETAGDNNCVNNERCLTYGVQLNSTICSFQCAQLIWIFAARISVTYNNFGDLPKPTKSQCLASDFPLPRKLTTGSYKSSEVFSNTSSTSYKSNESSGESQPFLIPLSAGIGSYLVVMALALYVAHRIKKRKKKLKGHTRTSPSTPLPGIIATPSSGSLPQDRSNNDEEERVLYQTLDEMADVTRDEGHDVSECDAEGYNIIQDFITGRRQNESRAERVGRPLPNLPSSEIIAPSSAIISDSLISSSNGPYTTIPSHPPPGPVGINPSVPEHTSQPSPCRPNPTPHRRMADLKKYEKMGLVYIQGDDPAFKGHTQVKLVRTEWGDLELISLEDEPIYCNYYSRLQLINLKDDAVGVVGVTDTQTDAHIYNKFQISETETEDSLRNDQSQYILETFNYKQAEERDSPSLLKDPPSPYVDIVFFGPLEMVADASFSPCDYLTALDIDPGLNVCTDSGYLTVLDIDPTTVKC
ncbi:hypothetical protein PoB_003794000 [Plakobranchus ocellatus]|uniref:FZ domain-containing protein n=1 Tax=Plakobranchus ocellatus TaxID=259542 RepID=A0AAV4AW07_9GAST|nr:hypothetical protein PoB_003794000 [Plakobranchus ocellatus]